MSRAALLARGVLAGACIMGAVLLTTVAGPVAAGVASVFPAIFVTTMVSVWWAQGRQVQAGAVGPMMLGSSAVAGYAVLAAWTFPALGAAAGAATAWLLAVAGLTLPGWLYLSARRRASEPPRLSARRARPRSR